jgi:hypothetical protein
MMGDYSGVQHKKYPCQLPFWEGVRKQGLGGCKQILRERNRVAKGYRERLLENRGHFLEEIARLDKQDVKEIELFSV